MNKKVYIQTLGCQMNVRDSEVVSGLLKNAGYSPVEDQDKADIVIFNTCSVRQHAEDKVWSEIGRISKGTRASRKAAKVAKPAKKIIGLAGCMAQNYKERVFERCPEVDFVVGPSDIDKIPGILNRLTAGKSDLFEVKIWETEGEIRPEQIYHAGFYEDQGHAFVVISEGCSNHCSYCVVPFVRGELHNRRHEDIIKEIEEAVARGITRVTLLGQNVNGYKDGNFTFKDLLKLVNALPGLTEFDFVTSHPRDTSAELFEAMAECGKWKRSLHLPMQSGSDRMLKAMNRGYTRRFYLDLVDNYRKIIKGGRLTTDIIVGFSGETEQDFLDTRDLVKAVGFDAAYIFKYSPRPNTAAWKWMDDVAREEKERRHANILKLQKEISRKIKQKR